MSLSIKSVNQAPLYGPDGIVENSFMITIDMADLINTLFSQDGRSIALGTLRVSATDLMGVLWNGGRSHQANLLRFGRLLTREEEVACHLVLSLMIELNIQELV